MVCTLSESVISCSSRKAVMYTRGLTAVFCMGIMGGEE
jgi:hypothetical protein